MIAGTIDAIVQKFGGKPNLEKIDPIFLLILLVKSGNFVLNIKFNKIFNLLNLFVSHKQQIINFNLNNSFYSYFYKKSFKR